uniref:Flagellar FliJ protein n=1 Tax=Nothoprocta perdicaria TaxID=30464 RepID=A0A8C7E9G1_NOTPE
MLKDYLVLAQEAIAAQKEIYQVKQQRLELAQQEYRQLHDVWEHKLGSQTSCEYLMNSYQVIFSVVMQLK